MILNLNLDNLSIGDQVKTKNGSLWTKLSDGRWKDETSGLVWLPIEEKRSNHYEALEMQTDKKRLPTKEEFEEAEKHCIRQILNMRNRYLWSASVHPDDSYSAYDFNGYDGYVVNVNRYYYNGSSLCVEK